MAKFVTASLLTFASLAVYAGTVSVTNNSNYIVEVSGAVNATTTLAVIKPTDVAQLQMDDNSVAHLMLIATDDKGYRDNILLKQSHGKLSAYSLYGKQAITLNNNQLILEK